MTTATTIARKPLFSILTKLGIEFGAKMPSDRAQVKLERAVKKDDDLLTDKAFTKDEVKVLQSLGLIDEKDVKAAQKDIDDEQLEAPKESKPAKKGGKKKSKKEEPALPIPAGGVPLMKKLLDAGKSEKRIKKVFFKRFKKAGFTDKAFVQRRIDIYRALVEGDKKEGAVVKKSKKGDKGSKKKAAKAEETPVVKKDGKKKVKKAAKEDEAEAKPAKKGKKLKKKVAKDEEE